MRAALQLEIGLVESNAARPAVIRADMRPAATSPMLKVADYCAWALHRKRERTDTRSYDRIRSRIDSEHEVFRSGTTTYNPT